MTAVVTPRGTRHAPVVAVGAMLFAAAVVGDPDSTHVPLCPLHSATGLLCPLCGGLRAMHALSRGALGTAMHDNVLVVAAIAVAPLVALWLRVAGRDDSTRRRILITCVAIAVIFAIARNLPLATALRPA